MTERDETASPTKGRGENTAFRRADRDAPQRSARVLKSGAISAAKRPSGKHRPPRPTFEALWSEHEGAFVMEPEARVRFGFWACPRPFTPEWGSGKVFARIEETFGPLDAAFGARDGIPTDPRVKRIDRNCGFEWDSLPFADREFSFGYWDPPFDKMYRPEAREIWRTCERLAILHEVVYPLSWFEGAIREAMIAVTMGPFRAMRVLQVFRRSVLA